MNKFFLLMFTLLSLAISAPVIAQQSYIENDELDVRLASADWSVLKNLRSKGDLRKKKRPVDHFLYPRRPRKAKLDDFIAQIKTHKGVMQIQRLEKKALLIIYNSDTKAQSIARMIDFLSAEAPKYGYIYDGWGTTIIAK